MALVKLGSRLKGLVVYMVLANRLEWLLAWRQIGLNQVKVVVATTRAAEQLQFMEETCPEFLPRLEKIEGRTGVLSGAPATSLVCCTGLDEAEIELIGRILYGFPGCIIGLAQDHRRRSCWSFETLAERKWRSKTVRHRLQMFWSEGTESEANELKLEFTKLERD